MPSCTDLVNLGIQQCCGVIFWWHYHLSHRNQAPECILLMQEKQSYGHQTVEALAVAHDGIMLYIGLQYIPELTGALTAHALKVLVVGQCP